MGRLDGILNNSPIDTNKLFAKGLSMFLEEQDPDGVEFTAHPNGWRITVKTDPESVKQAKEFWDENIEGEI